MTTTPVAEAIEKYAETTKDLLSKWSAYGSKVTTNLDSPPYKADTAAADLGAALSLSIQTGARLCLLVWNSVAILAAEYTDEDQLLDRSTVCSGATLEWDKDLTSGFYVIPRDRTKIIPTKLDAGRQAFKVSVNTRDCRAGVYVGDVRATAPDGQTELVSVRVDVPPTVP
jgi:hypothetical protein